MSQQLIGRNGFSMSMSKYNLVWMVINVISKALNAGTDRENQLFGT